MEDVNKVANDAVESFNKEKAVEANKKAWKRFREEGTLIPGPMSFIAAETTWESVDPRKTAEPKDPERNRYLKTERIEGTDSVRIVRTDASDPAAIEQPPFEPDLYSLAHMAYHLGLTKEEFEEFIENELKPT